MTASSEQSSEIKRFYTGKNVLITGITGVCGRVFFEKVLRSLTTIGTIFVLIRGKRNLSANERLKKLLSSVIFQFHKYPESQFQKIVLIEGDVTEKGLGISEKDRRLLIDNKAVCPK
ncbi:putative fatty acyl-CoA reductase-like protein [Leptotrombidium deliense]|uniref:Fatty acyl-CoA reductase n=1 Tax=Leptotrombidium deliense TaxID=299467 RepID=A0A443S6C3_9ACAR|nr:putative fatty acyl-CoA reductase-like protein [Leptotrombidium deliense]